MPKAKKLDLDMKSFSKLNFEEQIKTVQRLNKRANVRLTALEHKNETKSLAYTNAQYFNEGTGRPRNRYYEGRNYDNPQQLKNTFKSVYNFLNAKESTLTGIKQHTRNHYDYGTLSNMTSKQKDYAISKLGRKANRLLKKLEEAGRTKFAYKTAMHYNEATGRKNNRFYTGSKFKSEQDKNIHLQNINYFLQSETSTLEGLQAIYDRRLNAFRKKEVNGKKLNIPEGMEEEFMYFLESKQFKSLKGKEASNQVVAAFVDARNAGIDIDEINTAFEKIVSSNKNLAEVKEELHIAEWETEGGLLK